MADMKNFKFFRGYQPKNRVVYVDVSQILENDLEYFMDRIRQSFGIPSRFLNNR